MPSDASASLAAAIELRLNSLTKPPGSLGRLEELALRYGLIRGSAMPDLRTKGLYIFCADHGVTDEGVSAYPAEVTRQMVENFVRGDAAINVLCRHCGIDPVVVDMGVRGEAVAGAIDCRIRPGTHNFAREAAMTRVEAQQALETGTRLARGAAARFDVLGIGEMGIGNTTSAAAVFGAISGKDAAETVGRGAGVDDTGLERKRNIVRRALELHRPAAADPIGVLAAVGGFEIGAMAGFVLGAAEACVPVVADGFIACAGVLLARAIRPACLDAVFFSHRSAERGHSLMLDFLGANPYLDLGMRLGEGTGAALTIHLLECAVKLYREMATFGEAGVSDVR